MFKGSRCPKKNSLEFLKTISDLALLGASAEKRSRFEIACTVHTLSKLTKKLSEL